MRLWAYLLSGTTILRGLYYFSLIRRSRSRPLADLHRYERYGFVTSILNGTAMGLSFWLVAAHGDLTAQLVLTLINCFFAIATIANASRQFWIFFPSRSCTWDKACSSGSASAGQTERNWRSPCRFSR